MRQYSKRRPKKAQGWGSPTGGIPYSHYRSLGGFFAPGDEPKDCPEEQTLIRAMIDLNREIGGKTITPRKARAIYEDCRSKDKENNKEGYENSPHVRLPCSRSARFSRHRSERE